MTKIEKQGTTNVNLNFMTKINNQY